ncbi:MAG: hypothetical protein RLN96_12485, partial [Pseudomonadales bacterium]
ANKDAARLYITRIENNCILAELAQASMFMGQMIHSMDQVNIFVDFTKNIKHAVEFFVGVSKRGNVDANDIPYSKRQMKRLNALTSLTEKNKDGNLGITVLEYESDEETKSEKFRVEFDSATAKEAHKGLIIAEQAMEVREQADYEQVLMYFYQTNTDDPKASGSTGDKAVISHITDRPLKCYVISETDQQRIRYVLDDTGHNPLHTGFIVDVNVETNPSGREMAYRLLRLHDVVYDDEPEAS